MPHTLVQLEGDTQENFETWDTTIRDFLGMQALGVFLDSHIPEPDAGDWRLSEIYRVSRGVARYAVLRTLERPHIQQRLLSHGWDHTNLSPKYHYDFALELWGHLMPA